MLRAGVPVLTALGDIAASTENDYFKRVLEDVRRQTEMGMSLSDALELHSNVFPEIMIRLTRIGEETGRLDKSLSDVAEHLQKMEDLVSAIKRALIYPVFAIVTTLGALIFWLAYVLPKITAVLKEMGVKLPLVTQILIAVSNFTQSYWYLIPVIPVAIFGITILMKQNEHTRYYIDLLKLKLPILKLIVHNKLLAVFAEQMRIMIVAGIPINRALEIVSEVLGSEVFKRSISDVLNRVSAGDRIAQSLKSHPHFPSLVIRMVDIGETSGSLDDQFAFLSEHFLKRLDDISEKMGKLIEPIVIAIMGVMFAFIVVGLMFPLYELISTMGKAF